MASTTYNTDTELSSVNSILGAIGQSPVSSLYRKNTSDELVFLNPEISFVYQILQEVCLDVQNEGWVFNRENDYQLTPDANDEFVVPANVLRMDVTQGQIRRIIDTVIREGKVYDKIKHTYKFDGPLRFDIVWKFPYEELPSAFQRYITLKASVRAATQLISNPGLVQLLMQQLMEARVAVVEYDTDQGDYSFFGTPPGTAYAPYQPWHTLARY